MQAQPGTVKGYQKISDTEGTFLDVLDDGDFFGESVTSLGDLDGDGITDLAVGAPNDEGLDPAHPPGAIWILFLKADGTVKSYQKISTAEGGFTGDLGDYGSIGSSLASLGDLDGDGVTDLAVGSPRYGGAYKGAVWVLFLNSDGTVKAHQRITDGEGNFSAHLEASTLFGSSVAPIGDLDSDGITDLAVGAIGNVVHGAVWILFLNADGTVKAYQKISDDAGGFSGVLADQDFFGASVTSLGDLDGDGVIDLVVGAPQDRDGSRYGYYPGAAWVLFLHADGTVKAHQKISATQGGFAGILYDFDYFGGSVAPLGDLDGDGISDLAIGARGDESLSFNAGAMWILFLNADGTVKSHQQIPSAGSGFDGPLDNSDAFGTSAAAIGDFDGDGVIDLTVGATGATERHGAVWMLFLNGTNAPPVADAGPDQAVDCASPGGADVTLDGSASSDPDGDPLAFSWAEDDAELATGPTPTVTLTPGTHTLTLTVTDPGGLTDTDEVVVTVVADNEPPVIDVAAAPLVLWPANHAYHAVALDDLGLAASDGCDSTLGPGDVVIASVTSDEPENGPGDGDTTDDIVIGSDCRFVMVRAERQGAGNGRVYTLRLAVADAAGNTGKATYEVRVPKSPNRAAVKDGPSRGYTVACASQAARASSPVAEAEAAPTTFVLHAAYPNPFGVSATIPFETPEATYVRLVVFDVLGREVDVLIDEWVEASRHEATLDASGLPSGVYLVWMTTGTGFTQTRRVTLMRSGVG